MKPFDIASLSQRERPSTEGINRGQSAAAARQDWLTRQLLGARIDIPNNRANTRTSFIGDGFFVRSKNPATMQVTVSPGLGFQYDPTQPLTVAQDMVAGVYEGVTDTSPFRPLVMDETPTFTVPAAPIVGQARYDIIEVRAKRELSDYGTPLRYDIGSNSWVPQSAAAFLRYGILAADANQIVTPASSTAPLSYKTGIAAPTGTQTEPPTTPGYVKIARILVEGGATSIAQNRICDRREMAFPGGIGFVSGTATIATVRNAKASPNILTLNAPPGVRVAIFYRQNIPAAGFDVSPNILVFTGAQVRSFVGGVDWTFNPATPYVAGDNEKPNIAHSTAIQLNREIQGADIDSMEMNDPQLAYPNTSDVGFATGEYFSSIRPLFCAWNTASQLWNRDIPTLVNPLRFNFWAAFSY